MLNIYRFKWKNLKLKNKFTSLLKHYKQDAYVLRSGDIM